MSGRQIRRILVAVDASPHSLAAARAAADLAALLGARLTGLFVEDPALLRISRAPLARELDTLTTALRSLEDGDAETLLRAQAARARRALEELAGQAGVRCSFRVRRGPVSAEILAEASEADLVSLGHVGWSLRPRPAVGGIARALIAREGGVTLLLGRPARLRSPVVAVYDGSAAADDVLAIASQLAERRRYALEVVVRGERPEELARQVAQATEGLEAPVRTRSAGAARGAGLLHLVHRLQAGLLVLPTALLALEDDLPLERLLEQAGCPLLLVS